MSYSKREIGRAGNVLASSDSTPDEVRVAREKVNWWRAAHVEPLQLLLADLEERTSDLGEVLVAGRIKRLATIEDKLRRPQTPSDLRKMYDIAGCRAIVPGMPELEELRDRMCDLPGCDVQKTQNHDYLLRPRSSGYRSAHVILRYPSGEASAELNVELQLRTQLQHSWATAVEMYDLACGSRLKFNEGQGDAWRFFQVASGLIRAVEEPVARSTASELAHELCTLEERAGILQVLEICCRSVTLLGEGPQEVGGKYCLVDFDTEEQSLRIDLLPDGEAAQAYFEREDKSGPTHDVVLVRGASLAQLSRVYPNYFGDISEFIGFVRACMSEARRA